MGQCTPLIPAPQRQRQEGSRRLSVFHFSEFQAIQGYRAELSPHLPKGRPKTYLTPIISQVSSSTHSSSTVQKLLKCSSHLTSCQTSSLWAVSFFAISVPRQILDFLSKTFQRPLPTHFPTNSVIINESLIQRFPLFEITKKYL